MGTDKKWKQDTKVFDSVASCSYKCSCSHTVIMTKKVDKVVCSHCGNYVFKDKKAEFDFRMRERMRKRG